MFIRTLYIQSKMHYFFSLIIFDVKFINREIQSFFVIHSFNAHFENILLV